MGRNAAAGKALAAPPHLVCGPSMAYLRRSQAQVVQVLTSASTYFTGLARSSTHWLWTCAAST